MEKIIYKGLETPTAGIEPTSPEGRGLAIRCNTTMRRGHEITGFNGNLKFIILCLLFLVGKIRIISEPQICLCRLLSLYTLLYPLFP